MNHCPVLVTFAIILCKKDFIEQVGAFKYVKPAPSGL